MEIEIITMTDVGKIGKKEEADEDKELQNDLKLLVVRITREIDPKIILPSINMLRHLIRTSTCSMTSVPKPIKYLMEYYDAIKRAYEAMDDGPTKERLADIISVLATGRIGENGVSPDFDCLNYCLRGTLKDIGDWGHDYVRLLETEIVHEWRFSDEVAVEDIQSPLMPIVNEIIMFDFQCRDEIQGCDLLMEIGLTDLLFDYVTADNYEQICLYLSNCTKYLDDIETEKIKRTTFSLYLKFKDYIKALIAALAMNNSQMVSDIFAKVHDKFILFQMAFICARQFFDVQNVDELDEDIVNILNNYHLSGNFITFARELDILEAKAPDDVYKIWLEQRPQILAEKLDSSRQNLASSFVNGFVNCAFGTDKLLTVDGGSNRWIFRNKDLGMMSSTAALGLIFLWDVDGGLTPIDKFLYSTEPKIKAGALLALGIVNCRVRNECDPALALLGDYVSSKTEDIQIGAILGLGLAYAGTGRTDVLELLSSIVEASKYAKIVGIGSLACGLIALGRSNTHVPDMILGKIVEANGTDSLKSPFMLLTAFGVGLTYFGRGGAIEAPAKVAETFEQPFHTMFDVILKMCAYAGSGDVLVIQELLRIVEERVEAPAAAASTMLEDDEDEPNHKKRPQWDPYLGQALAILAAAAVSIGEEIGMDMIQRVLGHVSRYGEATVRKAVPLAIALISVSDPDPHVVNLLTKFAHDTDNDVACNATFGLGYVGAGTNNARLAQTLRQLAQYHAKNTNVLFMVRLAQGLVHLGKGALTLDPRHQNRQLVDHLALASLLTPLIAMVKPQTLILGRSHYLLYTLAAAIQPRWLFTLDEELNNINVTVRVGQAVDVVGKAGAPKTITGIHTHSTPVLLASGERSELVGEEYEYCTPNLEGICVLKKNI